MIEMAEKLNTLGDMDVRINTIAALAFWQVVEHSKTYRGKFQLSVFCRKYDDMFNEKAKYSDIQKCFDITPDNIKRVFKEKVQEKLYTHFLPNWPDRIELKSVNF